MKLAIGSSELWLLANALTTKIPCAVSYDIYQKKKKKKKKKNSVQKIVWRRFFIVPAFISRFRPYITVAKLF